VGQSNAIGLARETLEFFKATAEEEALTGFDPSGSSGVALHESPSKHSTDNDSNTDTWATQTVSTDHSTLSNDFSVLSFSGRPGSSEGSDDGGYYKDLEQNDVPTKELLLAETFPKLSPRQVRYTLEKCGNDYNKATDELLNQVFFDDTRTSSTEEGPIAKGIDAFSEDHLVPQRKKGKGKKKQKIAVNGAGTEYFVASSPSANRWQNSQNDVDFVISRTNLSAKTVSSLYHANGASLSATLLAVVRKDIEAHKKDLEPDAALVEDALTLNEGFPSMDLIYALAIVRLTSPSISNGQALAKALTQQPASETGGNGGLKLDLRYTPIDLSDSSSEVTRLPALAPSARPRDAASTLHARNEAFQKATGAYRRGGSTPVMRHAAAFYAQEGRDLNANLKVMNAAEADAFVTQQSGPTFLDLHGVTVADATRIAKQRTQVWWNNLGEQKIGEWGGRRGGVDGYRIITGMGRHSEGGRGKIGPAVTKMLVGEGWKVEAQGGEVLVVGHAKPRRK
jgi:hypothetical protein